MRSFATAIVLTTASAMTLKEQLFNEYIARFGKSYKTADEYKMRFNRWKYIDDEIMRINQEQESSFHDHNFLSDYTEAEYKAMLGLKKIDRSDRQVTFTMPEENQSLPSSWNWVDQGAVNAIQDQGQCGSCWAFSAAAAMESAHYIQYGAPLLKLSEQNFVSCSFLYGNLGCNGGLYNYAWNYSATHPIESEPNYPYTSGTTMKSGSCMYDSTKGLFGASSHVVVGTTTNEIMTAIFQQPQSVSVEADTAYFQTYTSGVLTCASCCGANLDHAIVAVGWGNDPTYGGYYIVRNSWGTGWGMQGYVNIGQADYPGICGINMDVEYPVVNQ